jgi:cytochrome oxidase assembly protein ShyY1
VRFLLSRRWVIFAVVVVVLGYGCYLLGRWQFHRLHDRETTNAQIRHNLASRPLPVDQVLSVRRAAGASAEWQRVQARGSYVPEESVVVRYQTREGQSGVDVVTPLRTDAGPLLLVDRGWLQTENVGADPARLPAPPTGRVSVTGFVRSDATGDATDVTDRSTRAVSSEAIGKVLDGPVYRGFVDLDHETPPPTHPLAAAELPDLGNGPHFFYGLQWWFFGVLAVFGFGYFAYDERRRLARGEGPGSFRPSERLRRTDDHDQDEAVGTDSQSERSMPPSTGSITPETKEEAGLSRNAAARPNSSGAP